MEYGFMQQGDCLIRQIYGEKLCIQPWGENSLRVRSIKGDKFIEQDWALDSVLDDNGEYAISIGEKEATIQNGKIRAVIRFDGLITFYNQKGRVLLQEYIRNRNDFSRYCSPLNISAREWRPRLGGDEYSLTVRFESDPNERLFGMGQYQHGFLNQKYCRLMLEQRNTQVSIPFVLSSLGYGFFWNNPAIGWASFDKNVTEWHVISTKQMDYWITAGDTPAEIEEQFADVVGKPPMMPDFAMGFWQSKLRYQTQDELLNVAREYKRRGLPISVIVVDFFHWTNHGDWKFDPEYWPDPEGMIRELRSMGIELMVSIWPTVAKNSENYDEMLKNDYLVKNDMGITTHMEFMGNTVFFDATNPGAREFIWSKVKQNYYDKGIRVFWLDEAEPEYGVYDFPLYRYYIGPVLQNSNIYPRYYAKAFYDGMTTAGQDKVINLVRCAWAGSQKYGALVWSGDVDSSFRGLREQFTAGLNMGLAGISWWTTDIGGFLRGDINDPHFHECLIRWFQYGAFCPAFRMHGERLPYKKPIGTSGGGLFFSGADNEVWSFGEETYEILKKYMFLREELRPYIKSLMKEAHEKGTPVIRPLFYDYPEDQHSWEVEDQQLFGPDVLVAPVMYENMRVRSVYLPKGSHWKDAHTGRVYEGGCTVECDAPLDVIPVFLREGGQASFTI
ncbi:glycoside hydrolase family 31 protein [Mahella sp.]|uniref:glycoside hydrolase family 31 protein n=1 Tax=Mahella sp. TaxID=2798721 RepID=UPI0025C2F44B|nr:glycoside hydrolase family 31 protein [Mahella sp.]MBZ4665135.1 glycoside hydrolase family 31 [Mahella sp.]